MSTKNTKVSLPLGEKNDLDRIQEIKTLKLSSLYSMDKHQYGIGQENVIRMGEKGCSQFIVRPVRWVRDLLG